MARSRRADRDLSHVYPARGELSDPDCQLGNRTDRGRMRPL